MPGVGFTPLDYSQFSVYQPPAITGPTAAESRAAGYNATLERFQNTPFARPAEMQGINPPVYQPPVGINPPVYQPPVGINPPVYQPPQTPPGAIPLPPGYNEPENPPPGGEWGLTPLPGGEWGFPPILQDPRYVVPFGDSEQGIGSLQLGGMKL
jgi:hypothetical protein